MEFKDILSDLLSEKGKTKTELSKEADIPYTTICGWYNGRLPDYNAIIKLSKYFQVTTDCILNQEANQITKHDIDEQTLLRAYRNMSPGKKKALFQMLDLDENEIEKQKKA